MNENFGRHYDYAVDKLAEEQNGLCVGSIEEAIGAIRGGHAKE